MKNVPKNAQNIPFDRKQYNMLILRVKTNGMKPVNLAWDWKSFLYLHLNSRVVVTFGPYHMGHI